MDVGKSQRVSRSVFLALWDFFSKKIFIKGFPTHQYFDILKSFCYFWALDMVPTWAGPGLLKAVMAIGTARFKIFRHGTWISIHDSSMIHGFPHIAHVMGSHAIASHEPWMADHGVTSWIFILFQKTAFCSIHITFMSFQDNAKTVIRDTFRSELTIHLMLLCKTYIAKHAQIYFLRVCNSFQATFFEKNNDHYV